MKSAIPKLWLTSLALIVCSAQPLLAEQPATEGKSATKSEAKPAERLPGLDVSKPFGYHLEPILQKVKANSVQRKKISAIVFSYRSALVPLRETYKEKRQDFLGALTGGSTAETIMTKQVEVGHLASEISSRYTLMSLEIRRNLSPPQIILFEEYRRQQGWARQQAR